MAVAVALDAQGERTTVGRVVVVTRLARLTELTDVAHGAVAVLDPVGGFAGGSTVRRFQLDVVQGSFTCKR